MKTLGPKVQRIGAAVNQWLWGGLLACLMLFQGTALGAERVVYYHSDALGSPIAATNAQGTVIWREEYQPYGERLLKQDGGSNRLWFTGKPEEAQLGISYFGARWYDPSIGQFLAIDPAGPQEGNPQSFNRYAYANNNPYRYVDPNGNSPLDVGFFIADSIRFTLAVFSGNSAAIASAGVDLVVSAIGLASPAPGMGLAIKAARVADEAADVVRTANKAREVAKEVGLSRSLHGEAAEHAADAIRTGEPDVLTINRAGTQANRAESIGGLDKVPGKHLDEYPPAMFREGGAGASVRPINPRDNMSAGACIGNACRGLPDGTRIRITVGD